MEQLNFTHEELTGIMLKSRGIHDGLWSPVAQFNMVAIIAGPTPEQAMPSAVVGLNNLLLMPAKDQGPLTFDAAVLNPWNKIVMRKDTAPAEDRKPKTGTAKDIARAKNSSASKKT